MEGAVLSARPLLVGEKTCGFAHGPGRDEPLDSASLLVPGCQSPVGPESVKGLVEDPNC